MRLIKILWPLALILCFGCNKPNSTPEVLDPIYDEMTKTAEELKKQVSEQKIALEGLRKDLSAVKPQTGQILYAQKRLHDGLEKLNQTEQMAKYWEVRAEARKDFDRESYRKAWNSHKSWPDPAEYEEYKKAQKAISQKSSWDLKARFVGAGLKPPGSDSKPGAEAKKEGGEKPAEKKE